jgi:hypothetical protein
MSLRIQHVRAGRGLAWVGAGFGLFMKHPLGFTMLFFVALVPMLLLTLVPWVGTLLAFLMGPIITLGFAIATRAALAGEPVRTVQMMAPFLPDADAGRRKALIRLAVLYAAATAVMLVAITMIGGSALDELMTIARSGAEDTLDKIQALIQAHPELRLVGLLPGVLVGVISLVFWHAPMLVWWHGQGAAQSLFSSVLACWRNKGAFAMYTLAWLAIAMVFFVVSTFVFALVGAPTLAVLAWQPGMLLFLIAFYVSVYFSYADSFASDVLAPA